MSKKIHINWKVSLFLVLTPIIGIAGFIFLLATDRLSSWTFLLALVYIFFTGLSITAGYHRLFSHKAYQAKWPARLFYILFGAAAFEGSVLEWCTDHRNHHRYVDTERDPYNINRGFWYAHIGWLFTLDESKRDYSNVDDLVKDPLVRWQHRHYVRLAVFSGFILPMLIAASWGDALGGLLIAGVLRVVINQHFTFCINSVCHVFGKRTYSKKQTARDNWFTALFTYGEGFHNFHHQFSLDYRNGIRFYHYDPSKWLIRSLAFFGLAYNLKKVSDAKIIRYRIIAEESNITVGQQHVHTSESWLAHLQDKINPAKQHVLQLLVHLEELEKNLLELKHNKMKLVGDKVADYKLLLKEERFRLKQVQNELKHSLVVWGKLLQSHTKLNFSN